MRFKIYFTPMPPNRYFPQRTLVLPSSFSFSSFLFKELVPLHLKLVPNILLQSPSFSSFFSFQPKVLVLQPM
jgi:hypothetical protein